MTGDERRLAIKTARAALRAAAHDLALAVLEGAAAPNDGDPQRMKACNEAVEQAEADLDEAVHS